ncbi:MAG TPA: hypothetical protein VK585_13440 [Jiangellaceae bacterium]|nr:hypothetical protein [Jiangellaceae bacterium]
MASIVGHVWRSRGGVRPVRQLHGGDQYNGHIYGTDILGGVEIFLLSDNARAGAVKLDHLNPQTQISLLP